MSELPGIASRLVHRQLINSAIVTCSARPGDPALLLAHGAVGPNRRSIQPRPREGKFQNVHVQDLKHFPPLRVRSLETCFHDVRLRGCICVNVAKFAPIVAMWVPLHVCVFAFCDELLIGRVRESRFNRVMACCHTDFSKIESSTGVLDLLSATFTHSSRWPSRTLLCSLCP